MGHMTKRDNNKYLLTVDMGVDGTGKRIRKTKTVDAKNDKEATGLLIEFEREIETGTNLDVNKMTVAEYLQFWLKNYASKNLRDRTLHCYTKMVEGRISKSIGHIKLQKLQAIHLINFYKELKESNVENRHGLTLSGSTQKKYHAILSSAFNKAVQWGVMASNPCLRVDKPKSKTKKGKFYEIEDVKKLFAVLLDAELKYQLFTFIAVTTGMRRGEIVALKWENIDFNKNIINVKNSAEYVPGRIQKLNDTKNEFSVRNISISQMVVDLLKLHRKKQLELIMSLRNKYKDEDYIFTQEYGKMMHVDTISKWFRKFLISNNLPVINFHGLRHTSASILLDAGVNLKALSEILGHSKGSTTIDVYSHLLQDTGAKAAQIMQDLFSPTFRLQK